MDQKMRQAKSADDAAKGKNYLTNGHKTAADTAVVILAGGRSSRMGQDKRRLLFDHRSFLDIAESKTAGFGLRLLSAGRDDISLPGFVTVQDATPECGPIGGILSCLRYNPLPWLMVLPCDMPLLSREAIWSLMAQRDGVSDFLFFSEAGNFRAMPALLRTGAARLLLEEAVGREQFYFGRLLAEQPETKRIPVETVPGAGHILRNINTPEDYRRLLGRGEPSFPTKTQPPRVGKEAHSHDRGNIKTGTAQV